MVGQHRTVAEYFDPHEANHDNEDIFQVCLELWPVGV